MGREFGSDGVWYYLHALPYTSLNSSATPRDIGPFIADRASPVGSDYRSISSTGGAIAEGQFNDLVSGVTVQLSVQDALAGLAVSTGAYPGGAYGAAYSVDAGQTWLNLSARTSYDGDAPGIYALAAYNGKLYAGQGSAISNGYSRILVFDGATWAVSRSWSSYYVSAFAVYNGKLYSAQRNYDSNPDGDVYVMEGENNWVESYDAGQEGILSLAVYNGKLYAGRGTGTGDGDIFVFDGTDWDLSYNGAGERISALAVYNGKLYAGQGGSSGAGDVLVFDGASWSVSYNGAQEHIYSLAAYDGKLYAGQGLGTGDGDILAFDGTSWGVSYNGGANKILSLAAFNGILYAGQGGVAGDGVVLNFDGASWAQVHEDLHATVNALGAYNGRLYSGHGEDNYQGDVLEFSPLAVSSMTGQDGAAGQETISAILDLASSSNTETCGGAAPCGATNQVKFFVMDMAGNAQALGPYAVLSYNPNPSAAEVAAQFSTGAWLNISSISFSSGFKEALYYRYVWDNSPSHSWDLSETVWNAGGLALEFSYEGEWYLHLLPYNVNDSSGAARHIGPFKVDLAAPAASAYRHISSTGGVMGESQFNDLLNGLTAQITVQDALSGLVVSSPALYGFKYSTDAGATWHPDESSWSVSEGPVYGNLRALAVYEGKLYAAMGGEYSHGFYVYDGSSWVLDNWPSSFNIESLTVYNGKLYAGGGDGWLKSEIYVFDGNAWSLSFQSADLSVFSLAVHDGKLYAGTQGYIYVFDGEDWSLSNTDFGGANIKSFAVYKGALYAGRVYGAGDGDVRVFNGSYWTTSYDGPANGIRSLAVYDGKLYAGQSGGSGDGDILVFDGASWSVSYDGYEDEVGSLAVFYGKLYAGISGYGLGSIYSFDGLTWGRVFQTGEQDLEVEIPALAVYENALYAVSSMDESRGDIFRLNKTYAAASLTGADGTAEPQTLFGAFSAAASTNTETCGGAAPCGATNQVRFLFADLAGNVTLAGPYAVITATTPGAGDIVANLSTGTWYNTESFSFASGFGNAAYYRYAWDASASHDWNFTEPQWTPSSGTVSFEAAEGTDYYLHILPYNVLNSSGPERHIGPFKYETGSPAAVPGFSSVSSTGGAMAEDQFNDLTEGVTMQIRLQDLLSGLAVSTYTEHYEGFESGSLPSAAWETGGDASWAVQALERQSGLYSLRSGAITNDQSSWVQVTVPNYQGGLLSFFRKTDFTFLTGWFSFYIDGNLKEDFSGDTPWQESTYAVAAGSHTFRWEYHTSSTGEFLGTNAAWLDSISFKKAKVWAESSSNAGAAWERCHAFSLTGTDGSTDEETVSAVATLTASTNTETCGGAEPCGATNQVRFYGEDKAGNMVLAGPFAVLSLPAPAAGDIMPLRSTGVWYNLPTFAFASDFQNAVYYRYAWDTAASHSWTFSEPQWFPSSATVFFAAESEGADYYLHALAYDLFGSSGTERHIGPFRLETAAPSVSGFSSVSSTGGIISEGQTNDLISGVTVQLLVQDLLSGLMVSDTAFLPETQVAPGGFAVRYSADAGQSWIEQERSLSLAGFSDGFSSLAVYEGKLYAGQGDCNYSGDGDVYVFDGASWVKSFDGIGTAITALAAYNGRLYAGQYGDAGEGRVYAFDGNAWVLSYEDDVSRVVTALAVYDGKLYAALNDGTVGAIYVFDGQTWRLNFAPDFEITTALAVYDGRLYAGISSGMDNRVVVYDGQTWSTSFVVPGDYCYITVFAVYNGKLYAGQASENLWEGDIYEFDGATWNLSFDGKLTTARSLAVHNGTLYAGLGDYNGVGESDIYAFDGAAWRRVYDGNYVGIKALASYNGALYAGEYSYYGGQARVLKFAPAPEAALTGFDGSTGEQTLSAVLDLAASTNTETCGGASPCGATNQVIFSVMDLAGNAVNSGPYAVITAPPADAGDVLPARSTGTWYNTDTFTFNSSFRTAVSYRYAWDTSVTRSWDYTEPQWPASTTSVSFDAAAAGTAYYLHVLPYDRFLSSGTPRDLGPFRFEASSPAVSDFSSVSSTGGFMSESQENDLASGVTVRVKVQDLLSGLSLKTDAPHGEEPFPSGGYEVRYSTNAGKTWQGESPSPSFLGKGWTYAVSALAVYNGKLYAGVGDDDDLGGGDIYVFDGVSWNESFSGDNVAIRSLAVYEGKLYAGQYGWDYGQGMVYVFDGVRWSLSYAGEVNGAVNALAVYNGKLYAAHYSFDSGDGDIYVFDGQTWRLSYDGAGEAFSSLAVYDGKLYAGQGFYRETLGDGDVYVFDGNTWELSFNSGEYAVMALAVYNGKLYAAGDSAQIYSYDGSSWELAFTYPDEEGASALAVFNGRLYAGLSYYGYDGDGDLYSFDGAAWRLHYDGKMDAMRALAVYNGGLYAGQAGSLYLDAAVLRFQPPAVSTMTGVDGSAGQETLSATLSLAASTNTETCGGMSPCGATNQVMFGVADRAGNTVMAGPYAVITAPPLSAGEIFADRSTGTWYNTSTFTFSSNFTAAAYYRYVWDNNGAYSWNYAESVWAASSATLIAQALASSATWYLHVLPYSIADSSGPERHLGPFLFDGVEPLADNFLTLNSTAGIVAEAAVNNLARGVTAQITVQDVLSGLATAYYDALAPGLSVEARGFEGGALGPQWRTGGALPWLVQGSTVNSGLYAAQGGNIDPGQSSYMEFTADVAADGLISFYRKTYLAYQAGLYFFIDNIQQGESWYSETEWEKASFPVKAGRHVFRWEYERDSDSWSGGSQSVWVDDIEYPAAAALLVQYSTTAGNLWATVQSSAPNSSPYISLSGDSGAVSTQTFAVYGLDLVSSTNNYICNGSSLCSATNQIKFLAADLAGNVKVAGPYAVLVDTIPAAAINDLSTAAVYSSSITITWTAPEDSGPGLGAVTTGWYRIDYATYPGYEFSPSVYRTEFSTQAVIGERQFLPVEGLCSYSTYYFAVYTADRVGNVSGLSNIAVVPGRQTLDCGFKMYDGNEAVPLACEFPPGADSPLRIYNHGKVYGIILLDPNSPCGVSRMRVYTNRGLKAVKKY